MASNQDIENLDISAEDMELLAEVIDIRLEQQMRERDAELLEMQASMNKFMTTVKKLSVASEHVALSRKKPYGKDTSRHNHRRAKPADERRKHTGHSNTAPKTVQISQESQFAGRDHT
jgi:hypothetical protein